MKIKEVKCKNQIEITVNLAKEIFTEFYTPIIGSNQVDYMINKFQTKDAIFEQINSNLKYYNVFLDNNPIGYFAIKIHEPKNKLFLSKLYIIKNMRGKGLSKKIFDYIHNIATENNLSSIWLHVNKNNPTIDIYKKYGYIIIDSVKDDIGGGFFMDDYIMELKI